MIQLAADGPRIVRGADWEALKQAFARQHCVLLKQFVDSQLLERAVALMERTTFRGRTVTTSAGVMAQELEAPKTAAPTMLFQILLHSRRLFAAMGELAPEPVLGFAGRCFKQMPGHFRTWHHDQVHGKVLGLSINLSRERLVGGEFEFRDSKRQEQHRFAAAFGEAVLFRIGPRFEHRVLPVGGTNARCGFAGWFMAQPVLGVKHGAAGDPAPADAPMQAGH